MSLKLYLSVMILGSSSLLFGAQDFLNGDEPFGNDALQLFEFDGDEIQPNAKRKLINIGVPAFGSAGIQPSVSQISTSSLLNQRFGATIFGMSSSEEASSAGMGSSEESFGMRSSSEIGPGSAEVSFEGDEMRLARSGESDEP